MTSLADRSALAGTPRRRRRTRVLLDRRFGGYAATLVALLALWILASAAGWVAPQTLPHPADVFSALLTLHEQGEIVESTGISLGRIAISFVAGAVIGIPLGVLLSRFDGVSDALRPYLTASYSIPLVVFYPFLLVVLGLNDWPVVVLTTLMTTIPIALNTEVGLRAVPRSMINVGRSLECTPRQMLWQIRMPAAWPDMLAGIKLAMVYAVVGVVSLEFVAAQGGLGNRIQNYYELFDAPSMYVFILLTLLLSGLCIGLILALEALSMRSRQ